jgi:hypothetical protein
MQQLKRITYKQISRIRFKNSKISLNQLLNFLKRRISFFLIKDFYIMKFKDEKAIIYYFNDGYYLPIINYKFIDRNRNLLLGFHLAKVIF